MTLSLTAQSQAVRALADRPVNATKAVGYPVTQASLFGELLDAAAGNLQMLARHPDEWAAFLASKRIAPKP